MTGAGTALSTASSTVHRPSPESSTQPLENQSFAGIARSMGAEGVTVDRLEDVGPALKAACEAQKAGKTTVIEIMCTRELGDPFRRDALAKPVRLLEKYKDFV